MSKSWMGPMVAGLIVVGVGAVLVVNLQTPGTPKPPRSPGEVKHDVLRPAPGEIREYPIGDPVVENHVRVAAVWLSAVKMEGMETPGASDLIHLEADIKATEDNPNGFARDEFVPYLKVAYSIVPAPGGSPVAQGELTPMVASDGLHYGANIVMPRAGDYRLIYDVRPPSAGGLGRHSDPATGVAPWWEPFRATFEWNVEPRAPAVAGVR